MSTKLVTIKVFTTRFDAELAKNRLESFGIKSLVSADDAGGMRPAPFAYSAGAELVVREEDLQKANSILNDEGERSQSDTSWVNGA